MTLILPESYWFAYFGNRSPMQQHYRSGSTKQELKGAALDKFMLQKKGKRWDDGVPVPHVSVSDLRQETAVLYAKEHDFITNAEYRKINETKQTLSSEELGEIVEKGILKSSGAKGRGAKYFLKK